MSNKTEVIPVIFRYWRGEVIAIFPSVAGSNDPATCLSYSHVGQHGACDPRGVIRESRPATPKEYAALKGELQAWPYHYHLEVCSRTSRAHLIARRAEVKRYAT